MSAEPATLLCVDDEELVLASLRRVFQDEGFRVLCATSALEGLRILEAESVAVILSDQRMPGMSGTEFLSEVRLRHPDTLRIILSGYAELSTVVAAINDGQIHKFIAKPWDVDALLETVRACFAQHRLLVANRKLTETIQAQNEQLKAFNADLSLRNQALQIYQEILEEMPVGVLGINNDGTLTLANGFGRDLLGPPGAISLGSHYRELLPEPAAAAVARTFEEGTSQRFQVHGAHHSIHRGLFEALVHPLRPSARERGVLLVMWITEEVGR